MEILVAGPFEDPEDGFGLQQAVLEEVAAGERGPTALMWTSSRYVGATRQETRLPGFAAATEAAAELGRRGRRGEQGFFIVLPHFPRRGSAARPLRALLGGSGSHRLSAATYRGRSGGRRGRGRV